MKRKIRFWPMHQRSRPTTGIIAGNDRLNVRFHAQNPLAGVQIGLRTTVKNHLGRQAQQRGVDQLRVIIKTGLAASCLDQSWNNAGAETCGPRALHKARNMERNELSQLTRCLF